MPGTDGFGCLRHVRAHAKWAKIPVIMYSADFSHERMKEAVRLGAQEYVVKATVSWSKLLGIIQKYLPGEAPGA